MPAPLRVGAGRAPASWQGPWSLARAGGQPRVGGPHRVGALAHRAGRAAALPKGSARWEASHPAAVCGLRGR
eukprot:7517304-Lingulodinium_polyedra.AAC.1